MERDLDTYRVINNYLIFHLRKMKTVITICPPWGSPRYRPQSSRSFVSMLLILALTLLHCNFALGKRFCGGPGHATLTRPCASNDTDCGTWSYTTVDTSTHTNINKPVWWWTPHACHYRDVSPENARKCMGNRTIACIGDSMVRDICQAVVSLLLGRNHSGDDKFDYEDMNIDGMIIPDFPFWSKNVPPHNHNGYIFPKPFDAKYSQPTQPSGSAGPDAGVVNHHWQLQMWSLYRREFMQNGQARDIIEQHMVSV
jgi:hypothetical protein